MVCGVQKFMNFLTVSAAVLGVIFIVQAIKMLISTIIRGYTLHRIYGWSLHLIGAFVASITVLMVHLGTRSEPRPLQDEETGLIPMRTIESTPQEPESSNLQSPKSNTTNSEPPKPKSRQAGFYEI